MSWPHPLRPAAGQRRLRAAWLGALLAGLLMGTVLFAPARWLAAAVSSSQVLQLAQARGTVWQGSAQLWLTGGAGSTDRAALPGRLHWRWQLGWQPGGPQLALALQADCCTRAPLVLRAGLERGLPSLRLDDGRSHWPAPLLAGLGTPWNTLQPRGSLQLATQALGLRWQAGQLQLAGSAVLDVQDFGSSLSTLPAMGSYRLTLAGGPQPQIALATLHGDLQLSGQGALQQGRLQFRGEARAAPGREDAMAQILNIIGRRDGARSLISLG